MDRRTFNQELLGLAHEAGLELSPEQIDLLAGHTELMLQWNLRTNLTRILHPRDIVTRHILDSLIPARWLPARGRLLDVGTGAGFPGIPLKILRPAMEVTLLEANRKKVSFLKFVLSRLNLEGIQAVGSSWEEWSRHCQRTDMSYHLITMRAVRIEPAHLTHLAAPLLRAGGRFAWWAGPRSSLEAHHMAVGCPVEGLSFEGFQPYVLPGASRERQIMVWTRDG